MPTLAVKLLLFLSILALTALLIFLSFGFALAKEKTLEREMIPLTPPKQTLVRTAPLLYDHDAELTPGNPVPTPSNFATPYRHIGPQLAVSSGVPYVFIRQGIPETGQTNNHMRDKVWVSANGTVHMVYPIRNSDVDAIIKTAADSNTAGMYYYNAYGCTGFNPPSLKCPPPGECYPMQYTFTGIGDTRPRKLQAGGIFTAHIPPGGEVPVVYGHRLIQRTDLGNGLFSRRGMATMKDSTECRALFSMDTTLMPANGPNASIEPVVWPINDSVWVATFNPQLVGIVGPVNWTYTTDYGKTWTAESPLNIYHPWIAGVDITSYTYTSGPNAGNTLIYVYSLCDPNDPTAFTSTERPVYLKGSYDAVTGAISWAPSMVDITGDFEIPNFLPNMTGLAATMRGDTLHVLWLDWNGHPTTVYSSGPGGHVHHAAILPDGRLLNNTVQKITDINIDGNIGGWWGAATTFGFAIAPWSQCDFAWDSARDILYALWSQPPDDGSFGYGDQSDYGYGNYDIFYSASPNGGRAWDNPVNLTATNNDGCSGNPGDECENEYYFTAAPWVTHDTIWIFSLVQKAPGVQETVIPVDPPRLGDPGPITLYYDEDRLYKAPARAPVASLRAELGLLPGDTLIRGLNRIQLQPRGGITAVPFRLSNLGLIDFTLDDVTVTGSLNDGFLATTFVFNIWGYPIPPGENQDGVLYFNTDGVDPANQGLRTGTLTAAITGAGGEKETLRIALGVYVVTTLCFNRELQIHSRTNRTDIGTEGSVKNQAGYGMNYILGGSDRFYDGGLFFANSELNGPILPTGQRRRVSRQLWNTRNLRCVADGILDSLPGTGGAYYNLFIKSVGTDINDSTLVWQNIWEQCTHPDSSDFLLQTTRVINVGGDPIDSVAMGVLYDIDLEGGSGPTRSTAGTNVGGDTIIPGPDGRFYPMGWIAGNDVAVDTCSPNASMYGFVVVPGSSGNLGDTIRPRGAMVSKTISFSQNIQLQLPLDTLFQRYAWYLDVFVSTRDRAYDTLTGVWYDTSSSHPFNFVCYGDRNNGPPYRNDLGYLAIAKKIYNFPVNGGGQNVVRSFGLEALAAAVDTTFSGPGETYTVIHVGSVTGMSGLITNAQRGIAWYNNHADSHIGPRQTRIKGDLNNDGHLSPADISIELAYVFANLDAYGGSGIPLCVADLNNSGDLSLADVVTLLNGVFLAASCPNCLRPCI